jgi:hypothetical protein
MLKTILTKGMPVKVVDKEWQFFYGDLDYLTLDGRVCLWDVTIKDYVHIPIDNIVTIEFFPQKYLTQERKEVNK